MEKDIQSVLRSVYEGKKVFLTGHTGFKGSWLLYWLHSLGASVKGYSLKPEQEEALYNLVKGDDLCESVIADIGEKERLEREITEFQPDFIFHLAAQPLVRLSYEIPSETFFTNTIGTAYVLDAMRELEKGCVAIMVTTDKVYENREWVYPYRENEPLGGYDPYSASKACAELVINSYRSSFFNAKEYRKHQKSIASARSGNVIGGGDWAKDRIIPDIIRALSKNAPVLVRNPDAIRPWQHVLEPLCGYLILGVRLTHDPIRYADSWNFGPYTEDTKTVEELVKKALEVWGGGTYDRTITSGQVHEAGLLKLDINKATSSLVWHPVMNSEQAIEMTMKWYKSVFDGKQAKDAVADNIQQFLALA